jgi:hypothetical protein
MVLTLESNSEVTHIDSDHELEELQEKMNYNSHQTAQEFYKLKTQSFKVSEILEKNFNKFYLNDNFDDQELIEEQIDRLIYQYAKIKENLKKGRDIRFNIEMKETQKSNELRYARNLLAHFGIDPENYN